MSRHARTNPRSRFRATVAAAAGALALATATVGLVGITPAASAPPVTGAAFTTTNAAEDGTAGCLNGVYAPDVNNCNIYSGKKFVWLSGGPATAYVGDGTYFFAVLAPGGQADPNDGAVKNLSDDVTGTPLSDRTYSVTGATITYGGSHDFVNNKIRLLPYDNTTNPGGVYILAICATGAGATVTPSSCKYDAFKVRTGDTDGGGGTVADPTVTKDAAGAYKTTYVWGIDKNVDATTVTKTSGQATFNYTVDVTHDAGTNSAVTVTGSIQVFNPNFDDTFATVPFTVDSVTDKLSDGTVCSVTGGTGPIVLTEYETDFPYTCSLSAVPQGQLDNSATVTWSGQQVGTATAAAGSAQFVFSSIQFAQTLVDDTVAVTDVFDGATATDTGSVTAGDPSPTSFRYSKTVDIPPYGCQSHVNTAAFLTDDTKATGSDSVTVSACRKAPLTGARTIGFWQGPNGIKSISSVPGDCAALSTYLKTFAPFQDFTKSSCKDVNAYVAAVIKAANASGTSMNPMLKAQMLATTLDTYFTKDGSSTTTSKAYLPSSPAGLGAVTIDLKYVCKALGGSCSTAADVEDVSSSFGGASSLTVTQMLTYAASQSNVGGSAWYAQVKTVQGLAKDAFDAVNNEKAFTV